MVKRGRPRKDAAVEVEELPEQEVVPGEIPAEEAVEVKDGKKDFAKKGENQGFQACENTLQDYEGAFESKGVVRPNETG